MLTKEGIIIRSNKYQESSKLIHVLSDDGINTYLVRNANSYKSKNYSYSQEMTKISFDYAKKNSFETITSGKVLDNYTSIKTNQEKMFDLLEIFEIIYSLSSHVIDNKILYEFVSSILEKIENDYHKYYLIVFKLKMLYLLGVSPSFSSCATCGKSELYAFDKNAGRSFCKKCYHNTYDTIYGEEFEVFKFLYLCKMEYLNKEVLDKVPMFYDHLNDYIDEYYDLYLGYKSKSKKIITRIQ